MMLMNKHQSSMRKTESGAAFANDEAFVCNASRSARTKTDEEYGFIFFLV